MTRHPMIPPTGRVRVPGPRDALDTGSLAELVADSRAVHLDVARPRPWPARHHDIAVPTDAPSLLDGFGSYGS